MKCRAGHLQLDRGGDGREVPVHLVRTVSQRVESEQTRRAAPYANHVAVVKTSCHLTGDLLFCVKVGYSNAPGGVVDVGFVPFHEVASSLDAWIHHCSKEGAPSRVARIRRPANVEVLVALKELSVADHARRDGGVGDLVDENEAAGDSILAVVIDDECVAG